MSELTTAPRPCSKCQAAPRAGKRGSTWCWECLKAGRKAWNDKHREKVRRERQGVAGIVMAPSSGASQEALQREVVGLRAQVKDLEQQVAELKFEAGLRR